MQKYSLDFARAHGAVSISADFRSSPEDFIVDEKGIELSGEGEHFYLKIKKRGENTEWIARKIADYFGLNKSDVGYAGKKDRHAVTTQWFSVYLPGKEHSIDWDKLLQQAEVDAQLLESGSSRKKLKLGDHASNAFKITLRNIASDDEGWLEKLETKLALIKEKGVPNYFGEQRFGREGNNLILAERWIEGIEPIRSRNLKGMVLSAARSYLFNLVLNARVERDTWRELLEGESEMFPSAPLWGRGRSKATNAALDLENEMLEPFAQWCDFLEHRGLSQERRATLLQPENFEWHIDENTLTLSFDLAPGQFATALLREVANLTTIEPVAN